MYNIITAAGDQATGGATDATLIAITGLNMSFEVEEDEMVCFLRVQALGANATGGDRVNFDFKVDGTSVTAGVGVGGSSTAAGAKVWMNFSKVVRLSKGKHTVQAMFSGSVDTHVATLYGTVFPSELSVLRLSNLNLVGVGVNPKSFLVL